MYLDLFERLVVENNAPPPPPSPPRPPFGSQTMLELRPSRIFFDGGMAPQMRESLAIVEEEEIGMAENFGSVSANRLFDETPRRPTARWELRIDPTFSSDCNSSDVSSGTRVFANAVADFVNAPLERGLVSKYPQTAEFGCEIWRFAVRWDAATAQCMLSIRIRDSRICKAPINTTSNTFEGLLADYSESKAGEAIDVVFEAAIPRFEANAPNSAIVRIKDPSFDTTALGAVVVPTSDGSEYEVYWNGVLASTTAVGAHPNMVVPNSFLPDGLTDVYLYTAYSAFLSTENATVVAGDRVSTFLYSYDIVFASGRRAQEVVESHQYITASSDARVLCACTDGTSETPCISAGSENAWIKFDLGTASHVKGIELVALRDVASPNPPPRPPPVGPPSPPPTPPRPPPPPLRSPAPRPPPSPPFCNYISENNCTFAFISHTNDGVCDDGGTVSKNYGRVDAETSICPLGMDSADCGLRCKDFPPPPPLSPASPPPPGMPPLPPCSFTHCVPFSTATAAQARCDSRSQEAQLCIVGNDDKIFPIDESTRTAATGVYETETEPSATYPNCDSGISGRSLVVAENECRDAAVLLGIEYFEGVGASTRRPRGCYYVYDRGTQSNVYAAFNPYNGSETACGSSVDCSYDPRLRDTPCNAALQVYECLCRRGADDVRVIAPIYACFCNALDLADAATNCVAAVTEHDAHARCLNTAQFGPRCAVLPFEHVRSSDDLAVVPVSLEFDGWNENDRTNTFSLDADFSLGDYLQCSGYTAANGAQGLPVTSESECRAILEWQYGRTFSVFHDASLPYGCIVSRIADGWNTYNERIGDNDFYCLYRQPSATKASTYTPYELGNSASSLFFGGQLGRWLNNYPETVYGSAYSPLTLDECVTICSNAIQCNYFLWLHSPPDSNPDYSGTSAHCTASDGTVVSPFTTGANEVLPRASCFLYDSYTVYTGDATATTTTVEAEFGCVSGTYTHGFPSPPTSPPSPPPAHGTACICKTDAVTTPSPWYACADTVAHPLPPPPPPPPPLPRSPPPQYTLGSDQDCSGLLDHIRTVDECRAVASLFTCEDQYGTFATCSFTDLEDPTAPNRNGPFNWDYEGRTTEYLRVPNSMLVEYHELIPQYTTSGFGPNFVQACFEEAVHQIVSHDPLVEGPCAWTKVTTPSAYMAVTLAVARDGSACGCATTTGYTTTSSTTFDVHEVEVTPIADNGACYFFDFDTGENGVGNSGEYVGFAAVEELESYSNRQVICRNPALSMPAPPPPSPPPSPPRTPQPMSPPSTPPVYPSLVDISCIPPASTSTFVCYDNPTKGWNPDSDNGPIGPIAGHCEVWTTDSGRFPDSSNQCNDGSSTDNHHNCEIGYDCSDCGIVKLFPGSGSNDRISGSQGDGQSESNTVIDDWNCCTAYCTHYQQTGIGCPVCAARRLSESSSALELWASDTSAFFGTLVAVFPQGLTSHVVGTRIDHATPHRYWTLRAYNPDQRMRLDSMRLFGEWDGPSVPPQLPFCSHAAFADIDATPENASSVGRRLSPETDSMERELRVLWKATLQSVSNAPPTSYKEAMALLDKLLQARGVSPLQNWTDVANTLLATKTAQPTEYVNLTERDAWWNNLEEHHDELDATGLFSNYPLRTPPKAFGRSPAASLVTALAMTNGTDSSLPEALVAEALLINASCAQLGGCGHHEHMLATSPILSVDFDSQYPYTATARDDGAWIAWLLSATIGPTVHLVASQLLVCASQHCGKYCGLCNRTNARNNDNDPIDVVRAVERALVGDATASTDVVECIQTASCVDAVAERAAQTLRTFVFTFSDEVRQLAASNRALWDYAAREVANASFYDLRDARAEAANSHQNAVGTKHSPTWVRQFVVENGRRLAETASETLNGDFGDNETRFVEWIRSLTPSEQQLFIASHHSAHLLQSNASYDEISNAHMQFVQTWARVGHHVGEKPNRMGTCADPQFVNRTISCRVHAVLVGKALAHIRREEQNGGNARPRRRASNEPQIREHIERKLGDACCARFADGREECGEKYCEHHFTREVTKRMAHVVRKLADEKHPSSAKIGPDIHAIIENVLLPELHADPACQVINQSSLHYGGPTRTECIGRSLLKHASARYGVDSETIERKMQEFGISTGQSLQKIQQATNMFEEVRSAGNRIKRSREQAQKAKSASNAAKMIRAAEKGRRMQESPGQRHAERRRRKLQAEEDAMSDEELARHRAATRGTQVADGHHRHGFGHSAAMVKQNRATFKNVSDEIDDSFRKLETRARSERLRRMAEGSRAEHSPPRAMSFHRDNFFHKLINPLFALEVMQADEGSLTARFSSGLSKLGGLSRRWSEMHIESNRVDIERRRRRARRLSEEDDVKKEASIFYDELDRRQNARDNARIAELAATTGRRLEAAELRQRVGTRRRIAELPATHALSWVHDLVHWPSVAEEWTRMHSVLSHRNELRMQGRQMHEILNKHPTGYSFFDNHDKFAFSKVGDAVRRLWHRRVNGTDAHFVNHTKSHADHAGKHTPERHGRLRRLSEGFLGPVVAAPYALFDTVLYGTIADGAQATTAPETGEDIFTATLRYVVYGTIGCYLTEPTLVPVGTSVENPDDPSEAADGDTLKVFRPDESYLCFPAIPFVFPLLPTWREFTNSEGLEYHKLTYEEYCTSEGYQERARDFFESTFGFSIQSETARWIGIPGALRGAEAIDSIQNFVDSANARDGDWVIGHIICGLVEVCIVRTIARTHTDLAFY